MICANCPTKLAVTNKSGLCRSCVLARSNRDPAVIVKRAATHKILRENPEYVARHKRSVQIAIRALGPAHIEKLRNIGRTVGIANLQDPETRARAHSPECREVRRLGRAETVLGWCPPDLRDEYRHMVRYKRIPAIEARRIIEAEIPGTVEHARRTIANNIDVARIREERRRAQEY